VNTLHDEIVVEARDSVEDQVQATRLTFIAIGTNKTFSPMPPQLSLSLLGPFPD